MTGISVTSPHIQSGRHHDQTSNIQLTQPRHHIGEPVAAIALPCDEDWRTRPVMSLKPVIDEGSDGLDVTFDAQEAALAIEGNFKWLDKNKNGSLAVKEFPKYF